MISFRYTVRPFRSFVVCAALSGLSLASVACGDLGGSPTLAPGTQDPSTYDTPAGALGMYRGVRSQLSIMQKYIARSGALTDELTASGLGISSGSVGATGDLTDERMLPEQPADVDALYDTLHTIRGSAMEAIGLLGTYAPALSPALRGEMYTLEGYADVLLAELYCSGVPLSTLDFQGDFTYKPSSSQTEVYQYAVTLFDSALAISSDSPTVVSLAQVAKGRALLDLGRYTEAAQAVAGVPTTFQYLQPVNWVDRSGLSAYPFIISCSNGICGLNVATREGRNGLPYYTVSGTSLTSTDPRSAVVPASPAQNKFGVPLFVPAKYPLGSNTPIVLASGIESRLIEAEAALQANPNGTEWLTILNTLRTTCTDAASCPDPAPAGTGGVDGLPPLNDPGRINGSDSARVTLLFNERAYWLFLTGHRQGDLRRLVRNYGRPQSAVYPTGVYYGGFGSYGSDVNIPIPGHERINSLYHGCLSRSA